MSCAGISSTAKPSSRQSFYLVTPFWNLKKVLAPRARCYYLGTMATDTPTTTLHARKSAVGLRVGHRDGKRRVSKLPVGLGTSGLGEARKHVIAN